MCGICGFVTRGTRGLPIEDLQRMTDLLVHRGPDDDGFYYREHVGLGSRRLSIIDLQSGRQPIANETGTVWVVLNGEIVNYPELRAELSARGHRFTTHSDTEVIIHLYEEVGSACVERLRGMFAFALWDADAEVLLLARDRLGIKPLYYTHSNGVLIFASELKSLLAVTGARELDVHALDDYITLGYIPGPNAIFAGMHRLPPAHVLEWRRGQVHTREYWSLTYHAGPPISTDPVGQLRALLEDAVRAWKISDVPVGVFLSGGVDSSTVTALMCAIEQRPVMTFSIGFSDPRYDELRYARQLAARYGTDHHELTVDVDQVDLLPRLVAYFDEPFADDSVIPTFLVSQLARRWVKVALAGDGGDELFGGYTWTARDQYRRWYASVPGPARRLLERAVLNGEVPAYARGLRAKVARGLRDASGSQEDGYIRRTTVSRKFKSALYGPATRAALNGYDGADKVRAAMAAAPVKDDRERMLFADQQLYLPDDILFKIDRMSMAHSLEVRPPLLDHLLVEFAASLPYHMKVRGLSTKVILRRAMRDLVPEPLLRQRKQGFSMPVGRWFRGNLGDFARPLLLEGPARQRDLWDLAFVRWMLEEHQAGRQDFGHRLWSLLVFETWARQYLDHTALPGGSAVAGRSAVNG
jgi:asparagine synthase (glutamine-hydrolysing)